MGFGGCNCCNADYYTLVALNSDSGNLLWTYNCIGPTRVYGWNSGLFAEATGDNDNVVFHFKSDYENGSTLTSSTVIGYKSGVLINHNNGKKIGNTNSGMPIIADNEIYITQTNNWAVDGYIQNKDVFVGYQNISQDRGRIRIRPTVDMFTGITTNDKIINISGINEFNPDIQRQRIFDRFGLTGDYPISAFGLPSNRSEYYFTSPTYLSTITSVSGRGDYPRILNYGTNDTRNFIPFPVFRRSYDEDGSMSHGTPVRMGEIHNLTVLDKLSTQSGALPIFMKYGHIESFGTLIYRGNVTYPSGLNSNGLYTLNDVGVTDYTYSQLRTAVNPGGLSQDPPFNTFSSNMNFEYGCLYNTSTGGEFPIYYVDARSGVNFVFSHNECNYGFEFDDDLVQTITSDISGQMSFTDKYTRDFPSVEIKSVNCTDNRYYTNIQRTLSNPIIYQQAISGIGFHTFYESEIVTYPITAGYDRDYESGVAGPSFKVNLPGFPEYLSSIYDIKSGHIYDDAGNNIYDSTSNSSKFTSWHFYYDESSILRSGIRPKSGIYNFGNAKAINLIPHVYYSGYICGAYKYATDVGSGEYNVYTIEFDISGNIISTTEENNRHFKHLFKNTKPIYIDDDSMLMLHDFRLFDATAPLLDMENKYVTNDGISWIHGNDYLALSCKGFSNPFKTTFSKSSDSTKPANVFIYEPNVIPEYAKSDYYNYNHGDTAILKLVRGNNNWSLIDSIPNTPSSVGLVHLINANVKKGHLYDNNVLYHFGSIQQEKFDLKIPFIDSKATKILNNETGIKVYQNGVQINPADMIIDSTYAQSGYKQQLVDYYNNVSGMRWQRAYSGVSKTIYSIIPRFSSGNILTSGDFDIFINGDTYNLTTEMNDADVQAVLPYTCHGNLARGLSIEFVLGSGEFAKINNPIQSSPQKSYSGTLPDEIRTYDAILGPISNYINYESPYYDMENLVYSGGTTYTTSGYFYRFYDDTIRLNEVLSNNNNYRLSAYPQYSGGMFFDTDSISPYISVLSHRNLRIKNDNVKAYNVVDNSLEWSYMYGYSGHNGITTSPYELHNGTPVSISKSNGKIYVGGTVMHKKPKSPLAFSDFSEYVNDVIMSKESGPQLGVRGGDVREDTFNSGIITVIAPRFKSYNVTFNLNK